MCMVSNLLASQFETVSRKSYLVDEDFMLLRFSFIKPSHKTLLDGGPFVCSHVCCHVCSLELRCVLHLWTGRPTVVSGSNGGG